MKTLSTVLLIVLGSLSVMANAQIKYTPHPSRAAALTAARYLLLAESTNLIGVNPGAETGDLTGWETGSGISVSATGAYAGTYKFVMDYGVGHDPLYSDNATNGFDLIRGQKYKIIFAAKQASGTPGAISIKVGDGYNLTVMNLTPTPTLTTDWKLYTLNFTAITDASDCFIEFVHSSGVKHIDSILITPEYLDMGLDNFSIDTLHQPITQTGARILAQKNDNASSGFSFYFDWTDYKYYFWLGDGTNTVTVGSAAVTAIQNQQYHWIRVTVDRTNDQVKFYVNGVQSGSTGNIASITGNISCLNELRLFGKDGATYLYKGFCDFLRFQRGALYDSTWMAEEWARIQAGRIRGIPSATALWDFNDDLVDGCQGLILTANTGAITYADGWPYCVAPVTYSFAVNYRHDYKIIPLTSDSLVRAFRTGAAYNYAGPRKNSYELPFVGITQAQYSAFLAAYEGGEEIDLWLDAAKEQTAKVYFSEPPEMEGTPYKRGSEWAINTTLYLVDT